MEVKVGVQFGTRELVVDSELSADDIEKAVDAAIVKGGVFSLKDEKGSRIVVPIDKLAYVEINDPEHRVVGFGRI